MTKDQFYINRTLELATLGRGLVAPNPMVGCVVVHEGKIIGEGYHNRFGDPHAEVIAIRNVKDKSLLKEATLYVSLEPCSHHGKTPPCVDLILSHKIPKVVIGCVDSFDQVAGAGIEKLKAHGCGVEVGILEQKCSALNKRFFTYHRKKRPYVILKWAQTRDQFIAPAHSNGIHWITQPATQQLTHLWRGQESAILIGTKTAITDNPSLTCRAADGSHPIRVVVDKELKINPSSVIFDREAPTLVLNMIKDAIHENISFIKLPFKDLLSEMMHLLYEREIQSVIIEGGAFTLHQFIERNLWDEARVIESNQRMSVGISAPVLPCTYRTMDTFGQDKIFHYLNE